MRLSKSINLGIHQSPVGTVNSSRERPGRSRLNDQIILPSEKPKNQRIILKNLRTRLKPEVSSEVPIQLATTVVINYILPMFEHDARIKQNSQRSETFGHKRQFSSEQGTVYSELKLSERLSKEICDLEAQLSAMKQVVKDNIQEKETILQENSKLSLDLVTANANYIHVVQDSSRLQREIMGIKFSISGVGNQLRKYKTLYEECLAEKELITKQLQDEKAKNDIRLNEKYFS